MTDLAQRAQQVLRSNDRGGFTVPSAKLYPHQWAWDSAFIAIGWAHFDVSRGIEEIERLFEGQWGPHTPGGADGRVPHIAFRADEPGYQPGPAAWRHAPSSTITNPPVWALALQRLLEAGGDEQRIRALLGPVEASHEFFVRARDPLGIGCVAVAHPWESGLDNSPAWDGPLAAVSDADPLPFARVDLQHVDDPGMRPTDQDYRRYLRIVREIADAGFALGSFAAYDPQMTALAVRAEAALAAIQTTLGDDDGAARARERGARWRAGLEDKLWNEAAGRYGVLDARTGQLSDDDLLLCHAPVFVTDRPERKERLLQGLEERYRTDWPLPNTPPTHPAFDRRRYWRGPTWININWLFASAVDGLADRTLELVEREGFREYFDPISGAGLGAAGFSWTAALCLDLLARG